MADTLAGASSFRKRYLPGGGSNGQYIKNINGVPTWSAETPGGTVTEAGANAANGIGADAGATLADKLGNTIRQATTTAKGGALLGADTGAAKLTAMPDGAAAVYSQNFASGIDSLANGGNIASIVNSGDSSVRVTATSPTSAMYLSRTGGWGSIAGKTLVIKCKAASVGASVQLYDSVSGSIGVVVPITTTYSVVSMLVPAEITGSIYIKLVPGTSNAYVDIDWIWIGDYSYLDGSLSLEAARRMNELGDTAGVSVAASGTITSNGTNVSDGDTFTIAGKTYTFKTTLGTTEGQVRIGATYDASLINAARAINYTGTPGTDYYCAAAHPLVTAANTSPPVMTITARTAGLLGNQISLAKSAATLTVSGSTLSGGIDAVGAKIQTQMQTLPASTSLYGAALLAADSGTTAGTVVQANDTRLQSAPATWTPVPKFDGIDDDGAFSISNAYYTRSGKKIHVEGRILWSSKGTKTGLFTLSGLPIAALGSTYRPIGVAFVAAGGANIEGVIGVFASTSSLAFYTQAAPAFVGIGDSNFTGTTDLRFFADYIAA